MTRDRFTLIPSVYLVLIKNGKILLSRRYNTGFHPGEYSLPAGHLNGGESLAQALCREAFEEIGVNIFSNDLRLVHVMHRKEATEERVNFFFTADKWRGEPVNLEPDKCDDLRWSDLNELPDNVIPYIKQAIDCILHKKIYSEFNWG
ncbi:NUDIX domain-containing protein [Candidatus Bathyarchaeota archaeon]|nr:NUDIX domain-containing protein [Candidatus Bathyarchaeota archaeon]